jgi:Flp pilus assembly protein protease CpaA
MSTDTAILVASAPFLVYIAYRDFRYRRIALWAFLPPIAVSTAVNIWYIATHGLSQLQKAQLMASLSFAALFTFISIYYSEVIGAGDVLIILTAVAMYPFTRRETQNILLYITPVTLIILICIVMLDICIAKKCTKQFPLATIAATATLAYGLTLAFI